MPLKRIPALTAYAELQARRHVIDHIDAALIDLAALRRVVVNGIAKFKRRCGLPSVDATREAEVLMRARQRALARGLPASAGEALLRPLVGAPTYSDIDQGRAEITAQPLAVPCTTAHSSMDILRLLPPPVALTFPLYLLPYEWQRQLLELAVNRVLQAPLREGSLEFLVGRHLAVEVTDMQLRWVLTQHSGKLWACDRAQCADASVRGKALDFLLLASRLEDADTLFFQRRLALTGDTELGLTARNLLDQLPWESLPLSLRIVLHRIGRLALRLQTQIFH